MKITDTKQFIAEYAQLIQDPIYIEIIEKLKKQESDRRKTVFAKYTSIEWGHLIENQAYNEKNKAVEVLSILLEAKEEFEKIKLTGIKYVLEEIEDRIKGHQEMIENSIGWLNSWLTMSVYTETDIILQWALALEQLSTCYDKEFENCKKSEKNDSTMDKVEEDNS